MAPAAERMELCPGKWFEQPPQEDDLNLSVVRHHLRHLLLDYRGDSVYAR